MWRRNVFASIRTYRILDLVKAFALDYKLVGIRPGEKLHEEMLAAADSRNVLEFSDHYVLSPNFPWFKDRPMFEALGGKSAPKALTMAATKTPS